jgi:hypothetical protein
MMKEKKIPYKQLCFAVFLLTAAGFFVYTAWRAAEVPQEHDEPDTRYVSEAAEQMPAEDEPAAEAAETSASPVSAHPSDTRQESTQAAGYVLYCENGALLVYDTAGDVSFPAGLDYELLPNALQQEIDAGKYFETEEALLEFLENYSS